MAFAALGAAEVLDGWPDHVQARALLASAAVVIGEPPEDPGWPWPEPRLSYGNAWIAEAVIVAGWKLGTGQVLRNGLRMLEWLLAGETQDGHLWSCGPAAGRPGGTARPSPAPIEVAALADACPRAVTSRERGWLTGVEMCVAWFLGDNDTKVALLDERTGGGCDGLTRTGRNGNRVRSRRWP